MANKYNIAFEKKCSVIEDASGLLFKCNICTLKQNSCG